MIVFIIDSSVSEQEFAIQQQFLDNLVNCLYSFVYSLFCVQTMDTQTIAIIQHQQHGYTVILRPSTITKATLPSIASAIRSLVNITQSPLSLPPYSLNDSLQALQRYEKKTNISLFYFLLTSSSISATQSILSITTNQDIQSITLILVYDNQDPSFLSNTPNTIEEIHIPLSFIHMQELIYSFITRFYTHEIAILHFPDSFHSIHISQIQLKLYAPYIMERPFLPISNSHFYHTALQNLQVDKILQQTKIDLALLLPCWKCSSSSIHDENESICIALFRFLSSTSSCLQLKCINPKVGLIEYYLLIPTKSNVSTGLLCRYASKEQILPNPLQIISSQQPHLKFDLLLNQLRQDDSSPLSNTSNFISQMNQRLLKQMK